MRGDVLIGADGIHSYVRETLYPNEGPARWNGSMLWRGALDWPQFLTGRSMVIAGGMAAKLVVYPIGEGARADRPLTNWAVLVKVGEGGVPPNKEDWSRPGRFEDLMPHVQRFRIPYVDAKALIEATPEFWEYPMCDRDPLPRWSHGRVTLLGDAAHPMYPVGSNGASQAILDARCLADLLKNADHPMQALWAYEQERLPPTAQIVRMNRERRAGGRDRRGRAARAGRLHQHRRRAVVRGAQGDRARLCRRGGLCAEPRSTRARRRSRRAGSRPRRRRQEHHLVLGGQRHHVGRVLLLHGVDRPEQVVELARRRHPEQAFHRLVGLVEDAVRDLLRQPDQVAGGADEVLAVDASGRSGLPARR